MEYSVRSEKKHSEFKAKSRYNESLISYHPFKPSTLSDPEVKKVMTLHFAAGFMKDLLRLIAIP